MLKNRTTEIAKNFLKNFEKISPEAQREILQKLEELCNQPCDFRSIVEELDYIIKH